MTWKRNYSHLAIRFKGFTDAWEQRTVVSLVSKVYGGGTPSTTNSEYWCGTLPWIQSSDLVDGEVNKTRWGKCISTDALRHSAAQQIPENSIAIVTRVGVGKLALVEFSYSTSQDFISLSGIHGKPLFVCYALYLLFKNIINQVQGTAIKGITKHELLGKFVMIPSKAEQVVVSNYFSKIDTLIALHQRKAISVLKTAFVTGGLYGRGQ